MNIRGRSDKYLASRSNGASIAREIYYRVVHSLTRLLSKYQPNRTRGFVFTACGNGRGGGFLEKRKKSNIGRCFDSYLWNGNRAGKSKSALDAVYGDFDGDRQKLV